MAHGQADDQRGPDALFVVQGSLAAVAVRCLATQDLRAVRNRARVRGVLGRRHEFARRGLAAAACREKITDTHDVARLDRGDGIVGARFRSRRGAWYRAVWGAAGGDSPALASRSRGCLGTARFRRPSSLSVRGATGASRRCCARAHHRQCHRRARPGSTALLLVSNRPGTQLRVAVAGLVPHRTFVHAV